APESARRPPAGAREYLPAPERRAIREFPPAGADARERDRCPGRSRPGGVLTGRRRRRGRGDPGPRGIRDRRPRGGGGTSPAAWANGARPGPIDRRDRSPIPADATDSRSRPRGHLPRPSPIELPMSHDTTPAEKKDEPKPADAKVAHRKVEIANS